MKLGSSLILKTPASEPQSTDFEVGALDDADLPVVGLVPLADEVGEHVFVWAHAGRDFRSVVVVAFKVDMRVRVGGIPPEVHKVLHIIWRYDLNKHNITAE